MRSNSTKQALVWGGLLILFGVMALVQVYIELSEWVWIAVLAAAGLAIFGLYFTDRSDSWLLIPGYACWSIAGLIALVTTEILQDETIAFYVLSAIAIPFLVVFLRNREHWWALIPAYVLFAIGLMVALEGMGILNDLLIPAYVMFVIAIPFYVVYARNTKNWWALIPAGIMTIIGLSFLVAESAVQFIAPAVLIVAGVLILARQFMRKGETEQVNVPPADEPPVD